MSPAAAELSLPDVFVARQPIFDQHVNLFGYELLFRSSRENRFNSTDQEQASLSVIANSFFVFGIGSLTGDARAFINFTRETILNDYAYALPRDALIVEILESVTPDPDVIAACTRLKQSGYILALDDFDQRQRHENSDELLDLADIVKIDFGTCDARERARYAAEVGRRGIALLAEKVETREDAAQAVELGYQYLQGYFFAKPEILIAQQAPALRANRVNILRELHSAEPNMRAVEELFRHDPDLSYKLLRHLNSAAFNFRSRISSIWRAITILGERGMRAWTAVVILAGLGSDHPSEVVVTSVTRARFCELIGREMRLGEQCDDLFLMGLFSMIDVLTSRPMEETLDALPLSPEAHDALLGRPNRLRQILEIAQVFERGRWTLADQMIGSLRLSPSQVAACYHQAMAWGSQVRGLAA
jgi:EAL and modified HD-GYP domain-containing signal transduction protein